MLWFEVDKDGEDGYPCTARNYYLTLLLLGVFGLAAFPMSVWIHRAGRRWKASFTEALRTNGESTERLDASENEGGSKHVSNVRNHYEKTLSVLRAHSNNLKLVGRASIIISLILMAYYAVAKSKNTAGFLSAKDEWSRAPLCTFRGSWGTLSWPFLDVVPFSPMLNVVANFLGTFMHCDGMWWIGNMARMVLLLGWFIFLALVVACYRGEGEYAVEYMRGVLVKVLLLASPVTITVFVLIGGPEAMSMYLAGPFGVCGATVVVGLAMIVEPLIVRRLAAAGANLAEYPGLRGPRQSLLRQEGAMYPFGGGNAEKKAEHWNNVHGSGAI